MIAPTLALYLADTAEHDIRRCDFSRADQDDIARRLRKAPSSPEYERHGQIRIMRMDGHQIGFLLALHENLSIIVFSIEPEGRSESGFSSIPDLKDTPVDHAVDRLRRGGGIKDIGELIAYMGDYEDYVSLSPEDRMILKVILLAEVLDQYDWKIANPESDDHEDRIDRLKDVITAVPICESISPDRIVCLEDGKKLRVLERHLKTRYRMTPKEYRERWGLPSDYPMIAPNYAAQIKELAEEMRLKRTSQFTTGDGSE